VSSLRREPDIRRLVGAMRHEKVDAVPNFEDIIDPRVVSSVLGKPSPDSPSLPIQDAIELARRTGQDAVTRGGGSFPSVDGMFCDWPDIDRWRPPDYSPFRASLEADCRALEGTGIGLNLVLAGPFFSTYLAVGPIKIQDFLIKLYDDLPFVERLFDIQLHDQLRKLETVMDLPISLFGISDDTCDANGFMCSPDLMDRIWAPRIGKLVDLARQKRIPIHWHCCGKLDQVIPYVLRWGIDTVQPIQPLCNDIYALKSRYDDQVSFRGNINIQGVLAFGTPEEVRADVRAHIDRLATGGGYIVGSSHSVTDAIPPENYRAMIEATWEYGSVSSA
jgi:uroporphyrinogen decarboxylase